MIHTLLDDDREWFNIPTVIRQVLKLVVKEASLTSSQNEETQHALGEMQQSIGAWVCYTRLLESDSRERIGKIESEVATRATESAERCMTLSRQVADVTAITSDQSSVLKQLERGLRQTKSELMEYVDSSASAALQDTQQRIKSSLVASMSHCESTCAAVGARCDTLQSQLKDAVERSSSDIAAQSSEIAGLHNRSLHASAAVKEALTAEMLSLSNRVSSIHQNMIGAEEQLNSVSTKVDALCTDAFLALPKRVSELSTLVEVEERRMTSSHAALNQDVKEVSERMERLIDERTEYVMKRFSAKHNEVEGVIEELSSDLARAKIDLESFQMTSTLKDQELRQFLGEGLSVDTGTTTLRTIIEQLSQKTCDREVGEWMSQLNSHSEEVVAQIQESREQLKSIIERDRQSCMSAVESVRADVGSIRSATTTAASQHHRSIVDLEKTIGALRNDTHSQQSLIDELRQLIDATENSIKLEAREREEMWANERNRVDANVDARCSEVESTLVTRLSNAREQAEELHRDSVRRTEDCVRHSEAQLREMDLMLTNGHEKTSRQIEQIQADILANAEQLSSLSEKLERTEIEVQHIKDNSAYEIERVEGKYSSILRQLGDDSAASTSDAAELRKQLGHIHEQLELVEENAVARVLRLPNGVIVSAGKLDEALNPIRDENFKMQEELRCLSGEVSALLDRQRSGPEVLHQSYFSPLAKGAQEPSLRTSVDGASSVQQLGEELRLVASRLRTLETTVQTSHHSKTSTTERVHSHVSNSNSESQDSQGYSISDLDDRFESHWNSLLMLLSRKEDHASLETKLAALRDDVLMEAVSRAEALFEQVQSQLEQKVNMSDLMQMFGSRNL